MCKEPQTIDETCDMFKSIAEYCVVVVADPSWLELSPPHPYNLLLLSIIIVWLPPTATVLIL